MNVWGSVFTQSPANAGYYDEEDLPYHTWDWPKGTWFQARLDFVREQEQFGSFRLSRKTRASHEMRTL
jgi:hypothetical protein